MIFVVKKLTDKKLMQRACAITIGADDSKASLRTMYACEHSPIRTQMFWIEMIGIPSFVSVHLVRHKIGVEHFVSSLRDDRGGDGTEDRNAPVDHAMLINATALIYMARKRFCRKSHWKTREVMAGVYAAIKSVDPDLTEFLVPDCTYRGNYCYEPNGCGYSPTAPGMRL